MKILGVRRSLLWTFTGAFLVVLVAGIFLQAVLVAGVLRPAVRHWRATTREGIARSAAARVADAVARGDSNLTRIVREATEANRGIVVLYRDGEGRIASGHAPGEPHPPMRRIFRDQHRGRGRNEIAAAPVLAHGETIGEVLVVPRFRERPIVPEGAPRLWLLFLPLAAILAGIAGVLLFRGLGRRLAHLEDRVMRIAEGDLDARVVRPGGDEIGRLGEAFNQMADRLRESRERLLEADRQRRRFLADVTHDLSTPLTTIRGYAETLADPTIAVSEEERDRYLRFVAEEAVRMDALVNDLLDLARVESGSVALEIEQVDLVDLARKQVARASPAFAEAGLELVGPGADEPPVDAPVDRRRMDQAIANLLHNERRYLPSGRTARLRVARGPDRSTELVVEDDGPGFAPEDLPHLFERFYRGNPARPSGGTGLGLAIVRGIARAHGGEAIAENRPEGGARVILRLPGADS